MGTDVNEGGWGDEIKQILKSLESTPKTIFALQQWLWENVTADDCIPRSMPTGVAEILQHLQEALDSATKAADSLWYRLSHDPTRKFVMGLELTEEEYYLVRAMGLHLFTAASLGLSPLDEYEIYCQFGLVTNNHRKVINPDLDAKRLVEETVVNPETGELSKETRLRPLGGR